jgi:hypothetical protein
MIALEIISIRYQSSVKSSFNERRRALVALCGQALELCPDYPQYPHLRLALREEPPTSLGSSPRCAAASRNMCSGYNSSCLLRCCFLPMARPAQALQVGIIIRATSRFRYDVVNGHGWHRSPFLETCQAQVMVTAEDARAAYFPLTAVTTLMPALALLVLLPPFITMCGTITRAICCCARTAALAARSRD